MMTGTKHIAVMSGMFGHVWGEKGGWVLLERDDMVKLMEGDVNVISKQPRLGKKPKISEGEQLYPIAFLEDMEGRVCFWAKDGPIAWIRLTKEEFDQLHDPNLSFLTEKMIETKVRHRILR